MRPKALIVRGAGTNCDRESVLAFAMAGAEAESHHVNYLKRRKVLNDYQIICLPGGFSYGDDLGAGKILALEFMLWLKDELCAFLERGGLMIGICNGFQIMAKMGILPDCDFRQKVTLTGNDSGRFESRWVRLGVCSLQSASGSVWLKGLPDMINLPVAHGEGKFYTDDNILDKIENSAAGILRYGGESGIYPDNPNGSLRDIAGITDASGRILGLMPHPERFIFEHQYPDWHRHRIKPQGLIIFENAVNYFK